MFHAVNRDQNNGHPERYPKFCVCVGITDAIPKENLPNDATYQMIRDGVTYFASNNENTARLYLWHETGNPPHDDDKINTIFVYAKQHEIASDEHELPNGVEETYDQGGAGKGRWRHNLTTWKLKLSSN